MPGLLGKDPGSQSVADIGTCPEILGKQGLSRTVRDEIIQQHLKLLRCHLSVVVPPDRVLRLVVEYDVLILGTAAGVCACFGTKCAAGCEFGFAERNRELVLFRFDQVPVHGTRTAEAKLFHSVREITNTLLQH